jgi:hypothetical protein
MDVGGSRNGVSLSEEAQCGGFLGEDPFAGDFLGAIWNFGKVTGLP